MNRSRKRTNAVSFDLRPRIDGVEARRDAPPRHRRDTLASRRHEKLTREKMNKEAVVEGAAVGVAAGLRQRKGATEEDVEAGDPDAPFEIERIFDLVDEDESNTLDREELRELFYLMEISISEEQLETIFAFADADGSGSIDMGEFRSAWARIQEEMVAAVMEQVGLSTTQIILFVACVTIAVCALFAFIFLAIGAWHDVPGRRPCGAFACPRDAIGAALSTSTPSTRPHAGRRRLHRGGAVHFHRW